MTLPADRELSALRIELLRARAEMERRQLVQQLDALGGRTRSVRGVAHALLGRQPSRRALDLAASAIGFVRRQPWIVPTVAGVAARVLRSSAGRWTLLIGGTATAVWWFTQRNPARTNAASATQGDRPARKMRAGAAS